MYTQPQGPSLRALELGQAIAQKVREKRSRDPSLGHSEVQLAFQLALRELTAELGTPGIKPQVLIAGVSLLIAVMGALLAISLSAQ